MKRSIAIIFSALLAAVPVLKATDYTGSEPGALGSSIQAPESVTTLTVSGEIGVSDLEFIATHMPALRTLNMQNATIEASSNGKAMYQAAIIPAMVFAGSPIESITLPSQAGLVIEDAAFAGSAIRELAIGENVKSIGVGAFSGCDELTGATINAATAVGRNAFSGCTKLAIVDICGATEISQGEFAGCTALTAVRGTENLVTIGDEAFYGCSAMEDFFFPASLRVIGNRAFSKSDLNSVDLAEAADLRTIGEMAFAATPLIEAILPENVTIEAGAFAECPYLSEVIATPSELADYVFMSSPQVNINDLTESVTSIGDYALRNNNSNKIWLGKELQEIGDYAMSGMNRLKLVDARDLKAIPELGEDVWEGIVKPSVKLYVNLGMKNDYEAQPQWQDFDIEEHMSTLVSGITNEIRVSACCIGHDLIVRSTGTTIDSLSIVDAAGHSILNTPVNADAMTIDLSGLPSGLYIVTAITPEGKFTTKFILHA